MLKSTIFSGLFRDLTIFMIYRRGRKNEIDIHIFIKEIINLRLFHLSPRVDPILEKLGLI
jgi:hypothetical protein